MFQVSIDIMLLFFFAAAIVTGLTKDINTFFFWIPFLAFILWFRFKQARKRWQL